MRNFWTNKETLFLRENYNRLGPNQCSLILNRPKSTILTYASRLRISYYQEENGFKTCSICQKEKRLSEYVLQKNSRLGVHSSCRKCNYIKKKIKYHSNETYRFKKLISERIRSALKGKTKKSKKSLEYLGCDIVFFIEYFKTKMDPNMTWKDVMEGKIHIDHIKPCNSFDLSKETEQIKCFHYTNLQPLWEKDNLLKNKKLNWRKN